MCLFISALWKVLPSEHTWMLLTGSAVAINSTSGLIMCPSTNEDPTVKGTTCGGMSGASVKSTNCLLSPSKQPYMLTCVHPCSCSHDSQQRPLDVLTLSLHVKEVHHILMLAGIHEAFTKHFAKVPVWKNNMRHPLSMQFLYWLSGSGTAEA